MTRKIGPALGYKLHTTSTSNILYFYDLYILLERNIARQLKIK